MMEQSTIAMGEDVFDLFMDPITMSLAMLKTTAEVVAQRIKTELQTYLGEYVLNVEKGLPYFKEVTKKNPNLGAIRLLLISKVGSIADVKKIITLTCTINREDRQLQVYVEVKCSDDTTAEVTI